MTGEPGGLLLSRTPSLAWDARRNLVALGVAVVPTLVAFAVYEATTPQRRAQRIEASLSGGGPSANAHWSILAMIAVAAVWLTPDLLDSVVANVLAFLVVGSSWIVTVYAYAVHYARLNSTAETLGFPGTAPPVFLDYFYLSTQVATTFSSSDVTILTTAGRGVVTGQTIIAFVFSTFVIAMLLSVIFLSG